MTRHAIETLGGAYVVADPQGDERDTTRDISLASSWPTEEAAIAAAEERGYIPGACTIVEWRP